MGSLDDLILVQLLVKLYNLKVQNKMEQVLVACPLTVLYSTIFSDKSHTF